MPSFRYWLLLLGNLFSPITTSFLPFSSNLLEYNFYYLQAMIFSLLIYILYIKQNIFSHYFSNLIFILFNFLHPVLFPFYFDFKTA